MDHIPVLVDAILSYLTQNTLQYFLDGTCGAGGHAEKILSLYPSLKRYVAIDQDASALMLAKQRLVSFGSKVSFVHGNFSDPIKTEDLFDGILIDIGVSSMQLDQEARGFSFMRNGPLDMRMDQRQFVTAEMIVNRANSVELAEILFRGGEERFARKIAKHIVEYRVKKPLCTTGDLAQCIEMIIPRRGKIHPATLTFQALRIEVNKELLHLEKALPQLAALLSPGGKFFVITFHSLEDRIVKNIFRNLVKTGTYALTVKKPIVASKQEMRMNSRSRSAKLRIIEKIKM